MRQYLAHLLNGTCRRGVGKSIQTKATFSSLFCHSFNCPSPSSLEAPPTAALPFRRAEEEGSRTGGGGAAAVCVCQRDETRGKCGEVFTDGRGCTRRGWTVWKNPLQYCRVVVVVVAVIGGRGFPHSSRNYVNVEQAGDKTLGGERDWERRKRKIEPEWLTSLSNPDEQSHPNTS